MKKIIYVGNFEWPHCTEVHVAASLEELGVDVVRAQENATSLAKLGRMVSDGAHLLLYTRTWNTSPRWLVDGGNFLHFLERLPIPSASLHLDLYHGLKREDGLRTDPFWRTKYVFSPDGSPQAAEFFRKHRINHFYQRAGVFRRECYLANPVDRFRCDVAFVGSEDYHREWPYRKKLVDWLRNRPGIHFAKHGHPQTHIRNHELNQLYASAKIAIGDTLCLGFNYPHYWSDRVYETIGRGGFLIHPRIVGMEEEFVDREHLVFYDYNNFDQLGELIDYYLKHDDERETIRRAGHELVRDNYTYTHRMRKLLDTVAEHEPIMRGWDE